MEQVIESLRERFPNRLPLKYTDSNTINQMIGNQQVVSFLIGELEAMQSKKR